MTFGCLSILCALTGAFETAPISLPSDSIPLSSSHTWHLPPDCTPLEAVWHTMDSMQYEGVGTLSCLYIGGSHVQSGWIGLGLRKRFEEAFPMSNQARGWMLPYRMAQTDTPTHFRTESSGEWSGMRCVQSRYKGPFGSTGVRAHTEDIQATWQHVSLRSDSSLHASNTIEVWGQATGCIPQWLGSETLLHSDTLANGSGWRFLFDQEVDTVRFGIERLGKSTIAFDLFATVHVSTPRKKAQFTLYEWGNNGAKVSSAMRCERWETEWPALNLDLIFIGLGINDIHSAGKTWNEERFEVEYDAMVQRIQLAAPHATLILLSNTDSMRKGQSMAKQSQQMHAIQQQIAVRRQCVTFDLGRAMGSPGCIEDWHQRGWAQPDLIHFTPRGYDALAEILFSSWIAAHKSWQTSYPVPSSHER